MRFRLRYLRHDHELHEGIFVIGRGDRCNLSLDDALVSRRHARLVVSRDDVTIEDLGSRNGVVVEGQLVLGTVTLRPGDRVTLGTQELLLLDETGPEHDAAQLRSTLSQIIAPSVAPPAPASGAADEATDVTHRANPFTLFGALAEKAIAMGRVEDAERLLATGMADVLAATRAGKAIAVELVDEAMRFAAKFATATGRGSWVDVVVEVYQAQGRPCHAAVVDELYAAMHKVDAVNLSRLRAYLELLANKRASFGPAERFLMQRLEGVERLAALR
jgi:hypothetical protein